MKRNLKRKNRRKMKKLHTVYEQQISSLQSSLKKSQNKLLLTEKMQKSTTLPVKTSSVNIMKQIATGPCITKNAKDCKKKLGQLLGGIPTFSNVHIKEHANEVIGKGQFGVVTIVTLKKLNIVVACKQLDKKISTETDVFGEVIVGLTLSGSKYFPFTFGLLDQYSILMEFFGDIESSGPVCCMNLHEAIIKKQLPFSVQRTFSDVLNAIMHMHREKILHNDIKADNFIVGKDCVKVIDFGKATLISNPKIYNIKPGSDVAKRYNTLHRHLAFELRNVPGSKQSVYTDIFSLGYMLKHMGGVLRSEELITLGRHMKVKEAEFRTPLKKALNIVENLKI